MWIRRTIAAGALAVLLVGGAAGAAYAGVGSDKGAGKGADRCAHLTVKTAEVQRRLDRLEQRIAGGDSTNGRVGTRRAAKFAQHKARVEQKLQKLQASCQS